MQTAQNYAPQNHSASPLEPTVSLPLVSTGNLYGLLSTLLEVYQLSKNPHFVAAHGRLLTQDLQQLSRELDRAVEHLDPLILEAIASHPVNA